MKIFSKFLFLAIFLSLTSLSIVSTTPFADGWFVPTHVYSANIVLDDAQDCKVTIPGETINGVPFGEFEIDPKACAAIKQHPESYRTGTIDGDALLDYVVGQMIVHTGELSVDEEKVRNVIPTLEQPEKWTWNNYTKYMFNKSNGNQSLAYAYGSIAHGAGDMFGHTWTNGFSGGVFNFQQPETVIGHIGVENYVSYRTPDMTKSQKELDKSIILRNHLAETWLFEPEIFPHLDAKHIRLLKDLDNTSDQVYHETQKAKKISGIGGFFAFLKALFGGETSALFAFVYGITGHDMAKEWKYNVDKAIYDWPTPGQKAASELLDGSPRHIPGHYGQWALDNPGIIPGGKVVDDVVRSIAKVIKPINEIIDEIEELIIEEIVEHACDEIKDETGLTCDQYVNLLEQSKSEGLLVIRFPPVWSCYDNYDNGNDGDTDRSDLPDCALTYTDNLLFGGNTIPIMSAYEDVDKVRGSCNDNYDNDNDGLIDALDSDCIEDPHAFDYTGNRTGSCTDGIDNGRDLSDIVMDENDPNCVEGDRMPGFPNEFEGIRDASATIDEQLVLGPGNKLTIYPDDPNRAQFTPLLNTVTLTKLTLLNSTELNRLLQMAGVPDNSDTSIEACRGNLVSSSVGLQGPGCRYPETSDGQENNVLFDTIKSLDADYQWRAYNPDGEKWGLQGFRLYENCEARDKVFYRIFVDVPKWDDTDGDLIEDDCDVDNDNDGVLDNSDNCPLTPNSNQLNTDNDSFGNVCDADDDGDKLLDVDEIIFGTDPLIQDSDLDGFSDWDEHYAQSLPRNSASIPEHRAYGTCTDGIDNDLDSLVDMGDPGCRTNTLLTVAPNGSMVIPNGPLNPGSIYSIDLSPDSSNPQPKLIFDCEDLGGPDGSCEYGPDNRLNNIVALSTGHDLIPFNQQLIKFSIDETSSGLFGTDVNQESQCALQSEAYSDEFASTLNGTNYSLVDEDGKTCINNVLPTLSLEVSNNLDSLDDLRSFEIDSDYDGIPDNDKPLYFVLENDSPSLDALPIQSNINKLISNKIINEISNDEGFNFTLDSTEVITELEESIIARTGFTEGTSADILRYNGAFGPPLGIYASSDYLGLDKNDVISSLCLLENGDGIAAPAEDKIDVILFTLQGNSPTLSTLNADGGDILMATTPGNVPAVIDKSANLGLQSSDNVDGMICEYPLMIKSQPYEAINLVNEIHDVTSNVSLGGRVPLMNQTINYEVISGPCTGTSYSSITNVSGDAIFKYSCETQGVDKIEACVEFYGKTVCDYSEKQWIDENPSYSVDVDVTSTFSSPDILKLDLNDPLGPPILSLSCSELGLNKTTCTDEDNIDGLSYGDDSYTTFGQGFEYSVKSGAKGTVDSALRHETKCSPDEVKSDIYSITSPNDSIQVSDEDGYPCTNNTILTEFSVGSVPSSITANPTESLIYLTNPNDDSISVVDVTSNSIIQTIPVGNFPVGIAIDENSEKIYVLNQGDKSISVLDMTSRNTLFSNIIHSQNTPEKIIVNSETGLIYVSVQNEILVYNQDLGDPLDRIFLSSVGELDLNPISNTLYVSDTITNSIKVIEGVTNRPIDLIKVGTNPYGLKLNHATNLLYVSNLLDDTVSVINATTSKVIDTIHVGDNPSSVEVDSKLNRIYVANSQGNSVTVINGTDNSVMNHVPVSLPLGISVDSDSHLVYVRGGLDTISVINPLPLNTGSTLQLHSLEDIDALVEHNPKFVDTDGDGFVEKTVYFSLTNSSTSLQTMPFLGLDPIYSNVTYDESNRGALYVLYMNSNGTVKDNQKISSSSGEFVGVLNSGDSFGSSITSIGDLNADSIDDLVIGSPIASDGCPDDDPATLEDEYLCEKGAQWVLFMDSDETVKSTQKISETVGGLSTIFNSEDKFGFSTTSIGDLDGNGITDLAVGVPGDDDGGNDRGAIWILFMSSAGTVKAEQKISDTQGNFMGTLDDADSFGASITAISDLDGNGITDLAVGVPGDDDGGNDRGAIWILFMSSAGTVKAEQKISDTQGNFMGIIDNDVQFGSTVYPVGDLDGNGITDLAVGVPGDDDGGNDRGAIWILFMSSAGTVKAEQKISDTQGNFMGTLDDADSFGASITAISDLDGNGITDLAVGVPGDDDGGNDRGAIWILFMSSAGTVKAEQKISDTQGNFMGTLDDADSFGFSLLGHGDLNGDSISDLIVGVPGDDDRWSIGGDLLSYTDGNTLQNIGEIWAPSEILYGSSDIRNELDAFCLVENGNGIFEVVDDDFDGLIDEDPIDGLDNDFDGLIDEDPVDDLIVFSGQQGSPFLLDVIIDDDGDGRFDEDQTIDGIDQDGDGEDGEDPKGTSPSTLLTPGPRPLSIFGTQITSDFLGLLGSDELDALKCQIPEPVMQEIVIEADPKYAENAMCESHIVRAQAFLIGDVERQNPLPNFPISFEVMAGPNSGQQDVVFTDSDGGHALFIYDGKPFGLNDSEISTNVILENELEGNNELFAEIGENYPKSSIDQIVITPKIFGGSTPTVILKAWHPPINVIQDEKMNSSNICSYADDDPFGDIDEDNIAKMVDGHMENEHFISGSMNPNERTFTDQALGGKTFGEITNQSKGVGFHIIDTPSPEGIAIAAAGSEDSSSVSYCGDTTLEFEATHSNYGALVFAKCLDDATQTRVFLGPVNISLDSSLGSLSGTLHNGTLIETTKDVNGIYQIKNSKESQQDVIIEGVSIPPNQSVLMTKELINKNKNDVGCLIAEAAYGTGLEPQVQSLREIRDNTVMNTVSGSAFMSGFNTLYYSFAPTIADMERENPMFKETIRVLITPMISTLSIMSLADDGSEVEVLGLGISVIALNLGMYIAAPALIIWQIKKRV